jgi:hypothetical protein
MIKRILFVVLLPTGLTLLHSCTNEKADLPEPDPQPAPCDSVSAKYTADIKPIITNSCVFGGCHGLGEPQGDFTGYNVLKAKADNGTLNNRIVVLKNMPPNGSGISLTADERKKIDCWIKAGAPNN